MSTEHIAELVREVTEEEVPGTVDLWPAIRNRVRAMAPVRRHRRSAIPTGRRAVLAGMGATVLALGVLSTTPAAQASVHALGQRFGLVLGDDSSLHAKPSALGTQVTRTAVVERAGQLSLSAAQQRTPFPIRVPSWLPAGLTLRDATMGTEMPPTVMLSYSRADRPSAGMGLQEIQGLVAGGISVPASRTQDVTVGGKPGIYVHGASEAGGAWSDTVDGGLLSWQAEGMTYVLQYSGLGLSRADLVRVAESLAVPTS